ncbi:MAG: VOC family protein, partial [Proteobacteria bacterium]|nr:VOC family protein [Pseudomonadota bacterium]
AVGSERFPRAYLEIIAVDPEAEPAGGRARWFDMDDEGLRAQVRTHGPRLIHWVARVPDLAQAVDALAAHGIDRGERMQASRMTPSGLLEWQITVRPDGQRLFGGCLPTLIAWGAVHPVDGMQASGPSLRALRLAHPDAARLRAALAAAGLTAIAVEAAPVPAIEAVLDTPRGAVVLVS